MDDTQYKWIFAISGLFLSFESTALHILWMIMSFTWWRPKKMGVL